ncbi:MAG: hypothetical protein L3J46_01720, partial [Kangiellaceae bacterium]|nr:hypothetical protein [Kangiellaceae bacterium]
MRNIILGFLVVNLLVSCSSDEAEQLADQTTKIEMENPVSRVNYPITRKSTLVEKYFNQEIADPYRWLEDDLSIETGEWVKAQNDVTFGYLKNIPYREVLKKRLEKLWNYEKISAPFKEGKY